MNQTHLPNPNRIGFHYYPDPWHYRNKMEFSFSRRRWLLPEEMGKAQADPGFALGLHVPGTFDKVLDVDACLRGQIRSSRDRILRALIDQRFDLPLE